MAKTLLLTLAVVVCLACIGCAAVGNSSNQHGRYGVPVTEIEVSSVPIAVLESFNGEIVNRPYRIILRHGDSEPYLYEFYTVEHDGMTSECYNQDGLQNGGIL